jgi:hypothetical protein
VLEQHAVFRARPFFFDQTEHRNEKVSIKNITYNNTLVDETHNISQTGSIRIQHNC